MVYYFVSVTKEVVSQNAGRCCNNQFKLGSCVPGKDDDSDGGKYWTYCILDCTGEAFARNYLRVLFVIVIVDGMLFIK